MKIPTVWEARRRDLVSADYLSTQRELHGRPEGYGGKGKKWAPTVAALVKHFSASSILDYGCGQGTLLQQLRKSIRNNVYMGLQHVRLAEYDPAIDGKDGPPSFADLVVCTDVLEHIEPDRLPAVLEHIRGLARKAALLVIALDPANKILTDGRNAHLILQPRAWWIDQVEQAFRLEAWDPRWPLPLAYVDHPDKQTKRVIVVGIPR
jgi:hypothetical protein